MIRTRHRCLRHPRGGSHSNLNYGGNAGRPGENKREHGKLIAAATSIERGKHEESALEYCLGNGGVVCVGADPEAAAYEDTGLAAAATAANHYRHDKHDGSQWDNHRVHSRKRDVQFTGTGANRMVDRVILEED